MILHAHLNVAFFLQIMYYRKRQIPLKAEFHPKESCSLRYVKQSYQFCLAEFLELQKPSIYVMKIRREGRAL